MIRSSTPGAERTRLHRERRRQGMRCVQVSLHDGRPISRRVSETRFIDEAQTK